MIVKENNYRTLDEASYPFEVICKNCNSVFIIEGTYDLLETPEGRKLIKCPCCAFVSETAYARRNVTIQKLRDGKREK